MNKEPEYQNVKVVLISINEHMQICFIDATSSQIEYLYGEGVLHPVCTDTHIKRFSKDWHYVHQRYPQPHVVDEMYLNLKSVSGERYKLTENVTVKVVAVFGAFSNQELINIGSMLDQRDEPDDVCRFYSS